MEVTMKLCKKCKVEKEEIDFYKNHDECKKCWNEYCSNRRKEKIKNDPNFLEEKRKKLQEWRKKNPDKQKQYTAKSLEKNRDKINEKKRSPEFRIKLNEGVKSWRKRNSERYKETEKIRRDRDRYKERARRLLYKAITRGHMVRGPKCEICGIEGKMEGHHKDYSKPLEVQWLCRICHRNKHGKLLDIKPVDKL